MFFKFFMVIISLVNPACPAIAESDGGLILSKNNLCKSVKSVDE